MQSRDIRNTVELKKLFTHSLEAKFPFNQYTVSTSVSDPEQTNNKWIHEYERNLHCNECLLSSSENKAWKQFRLVQDLNP